LRAKLWLVGVRRTSPAGRPTMSLTVGQYDHTILHTCEASVVNTERVTVTLPSNLLAGIDRFEQNRSRFITQAVEHELEHRRREELLHSVSSPHPSGDHLSELGTGDWLPDLVEDAAELVDLAGGTPVRWVSGDGWKAENL
jgi:hypothetical protein